ncbi:MAG: hypothetical protein JNK53_08425 [Phycisphaerae bacterium]|nr:hypothetical protein [Phycisphaerae bacterium]
MSTQGWDGRDGEANGSGAPDMTARVMAQLGYVQANSKQARIARRRAAFVRMLQGVIVLSAVTLAAAWWFGGSKSMQRGPEVVDTLRGSVTRGAGDLGGFLAGLPRLPQTRVVSEGEASLEQPPSASLEGAPQLRSY